MSKTSEKKTILMMEPYVSPWTRKLAVAGRKKELNVILVGNPGIAEKEKGNFDEIIETEDWNLQDLRKLRDRVMEKHHVVGLLSGHGLYSPKSLHGETISILAKEIGLPASSIDGLYRSNNKFLMRDALDHADIPNVKSALVQDEKDLKEAAEKIGFPSILKPNNMAGSSFVTKCENLNELLEAYRYTKKHISSSVYKDFASWKHSWTTKSGKSVEFQPFALILEGYISGQESSVECFATDSEVVSLLVHEKILVTELSHTVHENVGICPPSTLSQNDIDIIKKYAVDCIRALGITNCLIHVELRYSKKDGPRILEINPRVGGGISIDRSVYEFTGVDPAMVLIEMMTGQMKTQREYPIRKDLCVGMFTLFSPKTGILKKVSGLEEFKRSDPSILEANLTVKEGNKVGGDHEECFLINCFMHAKNEQHLLDTYKRANELINIEIETA